MKEQNYSNHSRLVPLFHFIALPLNLIIIGCAAISLYRHYIAGLGMMLPAIALMIGILLLLLGFSSRRFGLVAQDRAIRAEENLRYFAITGNLLDSRLTIGQIIALRFAPNNELLDLAHLASENNMSPKEIKQAIKNWKGDHHRV